MRRLRLFAFSVLATFQRYWTPLWGKCFLNQTSEKKRRNKQYMKCSLNLKLFKINYKRMNPMQGNCILHSEYKNICICMSSFQTWKTWRVVDFCQSDRGEFYMNAPCSFIQTWRDMYEMSREWYLAPGTNEDVISLLENCDELKSNDTKEKKKKLRHFKIQFVHEDLIKDRRQQDGHSILLSYW